jgi:dihydrolipoamide dehydrogenase
MKNYDLIIIGTGSGMNLVQPYLESHPGAKIAVIDKDPPGGICLTKGCIPTKMLVYPAEVVRQLDEVADLGIDARIEKIHFEKIMQRMHRAVDPEIESIRRNLMAARDVDYFPHPAEFTDRYRIQVDGQQIHAPLIFLCTGSRPAVPAIDNLENVPYFTSDSILEIDGRPASMAIIGGGYIAAEYGHFFSAMGTEVTIVGRNPQFLPEEEPEVSALAKDKMAAHMSLMTGHEVVAVSDNGKGKLSLRINSDSGTRRDLEVDTILVATGRQSNSDLLKPQQSGIDTDPDGWIVVDERLETTCSNIWAFGDANGRHLFKHVGNYEARIVYYNAILKEHIKVDYHAVPHAVFSYPEIAAVGMREMEAIAAVGSDSLLVGFHRFWNTAKGEAMGAKDYFVKLLVERPAGKILGAHIIGPQASVLIQEIVTLMYSGDQTVTPILYGMHIHPALSEVVERACSALMPVQQYREQLKRGML